jgi:hypothetical protein
VAKPNKSLQVEYPWFFWTCGETEGVANSFLGKMHPEALLDKDLITNQVCL